MSVVADHIRAFAVTVLLGLRARGAAGNPQDHESLRYLSDRHSVLVGYARSHDLEVADRRSWVQDNGARNISCGTSLINYQVISSG